MHESAHIISSSSNMSNGDPTSSIFNERETCFASGMVQDLSDPSRSIRQIEILERWPGNSG